MIDSSLKTSFFFSLTKIFHNCSHPFVRRQQMINSDWLFEAHSHLNDKCGTICDPNLVTIVQLY